MCIPRTKLFNILIGTQKLRTTQDIGLCEPVGIIVIIKSVTN